MRGTEKGKPAKPPNPGREKGAPVARAQAQQAGKPSKLSPMGAAKKKVR